MAEQKHTAGPLVQATFMGLTPSGEEIFHCGLGMRPPAFSTEQQANAARLVLCWNAHDELLQMARLLEKTAEYQIRVAQKAGDDEGARMTTLTLNLVRAAIAKAQGG